jgi:hypothetical protein
LTNLPIEQSIRADYLTQVLKLLHELDILIPELKGWCREPRVVTDVEVPVAKIGNLTSVSLLKLEPQIGSWSFGAGLEQHSPVKSIVPETQVALFRIDRVVLRGGHR